MASLDYQVVVLGAGPAGARCAELLARGGLSVLLLDAGSGRRAKLCGGLLNTRAQSLLPDSPPAQLLAEEQPQMLHLFDLDNMPRDTAYAYNPHYLNIDRGGFDAWLKQRAQQAGAQLLNDTRVLELRQAAAGTEVVTAAAIYCAQHVIDASGSAALSRRLAGHSPPPMLHCLQAEVDFRCAWPVHHVFYAQPFAPFFAWAIPKTARRWLLGMAAVPPLRQPAYQLVQPLLEQLEYCEIICVGSVYGARLTALNSLADLWYGGGRLWAIGEAAGLVSPFSGEGISRALLSAQLVAEAILEGRSPRDAALVLRPALAGLGSACLRAGIAADPRLRQLALHGWAKWVGARIMRFAM